MTELTELEGAIDGIRNLTEKLRKLRAVRTRYAQTYGARDARATFAELDKALKDLRKVAR